jgi:phage head maturation protease
VPYEVRRAGGDYCVVKQGTRKVLGRHPTKKRAHAQMRALDASEGKSMDIDDGPMIYFGETVKALGDDGRIGGHLVLWGDATTTDASKYRDFFDAETDFWDEFPTRRPLIYHHAIDPTLKSRRLGTVELRKDDAGIWIEGQMKLRDDYERKIYGAIKAGKMGLSSATWPLLMERKAMDNGTHRIVSWPIIEASITPTPAEPRTVAVALKTLMTDHPGEGPAPEPFCETLHATASALERALGFEKFGDAKWDALQSVKAALTAIERKFPRVNPAELTAALSRIEELQARIRA